MNQLKQKRYWKMKKLQCFLEKWVNQKVYETEEEGIYQIYAGVSKNGVEADFSRHGFNLYFGKDKMLTKDFHEYGFTTVDSFKRAAILYLYYTSKISAQKIISDHIVNAIRKGKPLEYTHLDKYIWEAKSQDCPEKWSVYIDLRELE